MNKNKYQLPIILDMPGIENRRILLNSKGEEVEILGLVLGREKGVYELNLKVIHQASKTKARILVKGIAENGAMVKINGRVVMAAGLKKLDDSLNVKVLVLDNISGAVVDPQMEIESNEVKASHAATVGRIDQEKIFYLMSRGLSEKAAKEIIVDGFLGDIRNKI